MKKIYVADCETDPFKAGRIPAPFIWGVYSENEYHEFFDTNDFMSFITEQDCIVYAHNGGKFDWHFVLDWIVPDQEVLIINGRLSRFEIGLAEFRDSFNILPVPLSAFKKDDFDYTKMEKENRSQYMEEIRTYLKNDCLYLYEIIQRFIADYGLHMTLATAALKTWEKITGIKAPKTNQEYYHDLKPFYYGGRVECFEAGIIKDHFNVVDINSAYPFAMYSKHPFGQNFFEFEQLPHKREDIAVSFIEVYCVSRGAFPFRDADGSLSFPRDDIKRHYFITGHEYLAALDNNAITNIQIMRVVSFSETIDFKQYIDHFFALKTSSKQKEDKAGYLLAKLFLNSLYGKFASNPETYNTHKFVRPQHIEAEEESGWKFSGMINRWALVKQPLDEDKQTFYDIAVGASITGFVRAYMFDSIAKCKGVIYCDTDSIAARDSSALDYCPVTLGKWDIEAVCDFGAVAGKKMYAFRDKNTGKYKTASKGVKFTAKEIIKVAQKEKVKYVSEAPTFSIRKDPTFIDRTVAFNAKIN